MHHPTLTDKSLCCVFVLISSDPWCRVPSKPMDSKNTINDPSPAGLLCGYSLHLHLPQAPDKSEPKQSERILEKGEPDCRNQSSQMETDQWVQKTNWVSGRSAATQLHHAAGLCQDNWRWPVLLQDWNVKIQKLLLQRKCSVHWC